MLKNGIVFHFWPKIGKILIPWHWTYLRGADGHSFTNFWSKMENDTIFQHFFYQKVLNLSKFFRKSQKKIFKIFLQHLPAKIFSHFWKLQFYLASEPTVKFSMLGKQSNWLTGVEKLRKFLCARICATIENFWGGFKCTNKNFQIFKFWGRQVKFHQKSSLHASF